MATEEERAKDVARIQEELKEVELLVPLELYLVTGIRIGTRMKSRFMKRFIYGIRPDGLYLLDVQEIDRRIRIASRFIARYDPARIVVVSARQYGFTPVQKFCALTGCMSIIGRFPPGILTNPQFSNYIEADLLIATDPRVDFQAISEASTIGIPVVAFCDTDSSVENVDVVIPANNRGRKSLALLYWLLARQVLRERGELPPGGELPIPPEEFEAKVILTSEV
ncbi:MAG: 30S ribosomal protein S2 [Thermofilaceae archaeon]